MGFPKEFVWGAATASYQVEGAAYEGGKGLSVWDVFCKEPGHVFNNHTGDVSCDQYHLYREDAKLMKELGLQAYRFSVSWPRVMPEGTGRVNQAGLDYYDRLTDALLENDVQPYCTLFHWDYPWELQLRGGWMNPDSPEWFAEYTRVIADRLGDRVKTYMTLNEPMCFIGLSFQDNKHAPGMRAPRKAALQMAHNVLLAHGKSVQTLRARVPGSLVSYAPTGITYIPASDRPEDIEAARKANFTPGDNWWECIAMWSDPVMLGRYPEEAERVFGTDMPEIKPDDLRTMCQPLDMYGQNLYYSWLVESDGKGGWRGVNHPQGISKNALNWPNTPESMYWVLKFLYARYQTPILITENGMACHDAVFMDGRVHDPNRINYTQRYLLEMEKAMAEGVDVRGYFHWSLVDNFEWSEGYNERIGLVYVDYATQKRIVKDSAYWYRRLIQTNGASLRETNYQPEE